MVLRKPARVLRVLGELKPMGAIGPVSLEEVRDVLSERLRTIDEHPPAHRYGAVFVGSPHQARGRAFRVVFVPGLAERMFPQKPREDPMLLDDEMREPLAAGLAVQEDRAQDRASAPAAGGRRGDASVSGSRIRASTSAARARACRRSTCSTSCARSRGTSPTTSRCSAGRCVEGGAKLDWPAPARPSDAIDDVEHDLADAARSDRRAEPGRGAGPCPLSAAAERRAAPIGHDALGARALALAAAGRAGARRRPARRRCWPRSGSGRGRTRCRPCRSSPRARTSSCCRRSIVSSRTTSRSRCSGSIR